MKEKGKEKAHTDESVRMSLNIHNRKERRWKKNKGMEKGGFMVKRDLI